MGLVARVQTYKDKLKKEPNNVNLRHMQKTWTPQGHRSIKSHLCVIKKHGKKESNKVNVDTDKHT